MMDRRGFLKALGATMGLATVPAALVAPERRIYQVPANAPVPARSATFNNLAGDAWALSAESFRKPREMLYAGAALPGKSAALLAWYPPGQSVVTVGQSNAAYIEDYDEVLPFCAEHFQELQERGGETVRGIIERVNEATLQVQHASERFMEQVQREVAHAMLAGDFKIVPIDPSDREKAEALEKFVKRQFANGYTIEST